MATRSRIGIEKEDGTILSIYCHWDGYPSHNGRILLESYTDKEKVSDLIELGSISILAKNLTPIDGAAHDFDKPAKDVVVAYHRDRGEGLQIPRVNASVEAFAKSDFEEYGYIFTKEGQWKIVYGDAQVEDLTQKICDGGEYFLE
jgi:hypothetical protein